MYFKIEVKQSNYARSAALLNIHVNGHRQEEWLNSNTISMGQTELSQLYRYLNLSLLIETFLPQRLYHNFDISVNNKTCLTVIRLQDKRYLPNLYNITGGAGFRTVVSTDHHLFACPYVDYTNGTYDILCLTNTGYRHDITLILTYIDYGAFRWDGLFINDTLWRGQILNNNCQPTITRSTYIGWYRDDRQSDWKWVRGNKEIISDNDLRSCIRNQKTMVEMVGDSHLAFVYQYLYYLFNKLTPDMVRGRLTPTSFLGYRYRRVAYILHEDDIPEFLSDANAMLPKTRRLLSGKFLPTLMSALQKWKERYDKQIIQSFKKPRAHSQLSSYASVLVIQTGMWDTAFRNIKYFVKYSVPAFKSLLDSISADPVLSKVGIIVWGPAAFNEKNHTDIEMNTTDKVILFNNILLAAANELLKETTKAYSNVIYVDYFSTLFCRSDHSVDRAHFLMSRLRNNNVSFEGKVGKISAKLLLETICTQ